MRRQKSYVYKPVQRWLVWMTLSYLFVYSVVFLGLLFLPLIAPLVGSAVWVELHADIAEFLLDDPAMWIGVAVTLLAIGVHSIFRSQKLAGPLYVLDNALDDTLGGKVTGEIRLRDGDHLVEIMDKWNLVLAMFRDQFRSLDAAQAELSDEIEKLDAALEDDVKTPAVRDALDKIVAKRESIEHVLQEVEYRRSDSENGTR